MICAERFVSDCMLIRKQSPIIHNMTNYVAMEIAADSLLAIGASPIMSLCAQEAAEIVALCSALVINTGCVDPIQAEAMVMAAEEAVRLGRPWVLDPVGAGLSGLRSDICRRLAGMGPSVIRGNASEIATLSCGEAAHHGVDSAVNAETAVGLAMELARRTGAAVSMSGPTDYITDGSAVETVTNGSEMMRRVTATGCTASAVTGAFLAVDADPMQAALGAMALMGVCGQEAAAVSGGATGTFRREFLNRLSTYDPAETATKIRQA